MRIGLARGPVLASGGDLFGMAQSLAARLCAAAGVGEVWAPGDLASDLATAGIVAERRGSLALKGVPGVVDAVVLVAPAPPSSSSLPS